ncbi:DUF7266 family protein [Haloarcula onubensis]|uniref:Uncharacterized protein n=1 Tax=Haloarcula onubensis TaxID=2950539 RepID=A0ABU2FQE2_9EURY|nr:hypothetical protein [Halomicroarcula sp. S3CR25-11]MDS0282978.1 hypothetical protein [Halomicroarcula sp. S3CR25-11]
MRGDTRAVSPAVTQALTIGITTILVTGLLLSGGAFLKTEQEDIARQGLIDIGAGVSSDLVRLDQFDAASGTRNISFTSTYPDRVGGDGYRVHLTPGPTETTIYVNTTASSFTTAVRFRNTTAVCERRVRGGTIVVAYNGTERCLEVRKG